MPSRPRPPAEAWTAGHKPLYRGLVWRIRQTNRGCGDMAVVTISELVEAVGISETNLRERCTDEHLNIVARFLDWRSTAPYLGLSETEIEDIEDEDRRNEVRRRKTLQIWKRKHCFKATYRRLVEVFLCLGRADHAEELCRLLLPG